MKISTLFSCAIIATIAIACGPKKETAEVASTPEPVVVDSVTVPLAGVIIDEDKVDAIPLVHHHHPATKEKTAKKEPVSEPVPVHHDSLKVELVELEFTPVVEVDRSVSLIPVDDTQTLISYKKNGQQKAVFQVTTTADGEIENILFADASHKDVYNVQTGMTAKEVKKLRRELKHMEKHGKHFLYDDNSRIMYLLDTNLSDGEEVTEASLDNAEVQAIIWKGKKGKG